MYHSVIGKRLVECVNRRDGTAYTVREFFDTVYVPLFFGKAPMLQYVNNSPFDQAIGKQKKVLTDKLIESCLEQVHSKAQGQAPDASFFLGGPASGSMETTSGQVTAMRIPVLEEDVYASWIGAALGLTVQGGMILLIDVEDVLLTTYDGWFKYREFLEQTPTLKPLQVTAWNGQWVTSKIGKDADFQPALDKDCAALETQKWVRLMFSLSYHYRDNSTNRVLTYVYLLGQSNTTLGFVRLNLFEVNRLVQLYRKLFTVPEGMHAADFERLYDTAESFRFACGHTEIGLSALKPQDVFRGEKGVPAVPKSTESKKRLAFDTYQTWIIAMLKNEELLTRAEEMAAALYQFQQQDQRLKTKKAEMVEKLIKTTNWKSFVEGLTEVLNEDSGNGELFNQVVVDTASLTSDKVPLFLMLLRFKYAFIKAKSKETTL